MDSNSDVAIFGYLVNALSKRGRGRDEGASFPISDADDFSRGARFIPGEVTMARRRGEIVDFVTRCSPNCWYWEMPDGSRIYHYDPATYRSIGVANGRRMSEDRYGDVSFEKGPGPCPRCGNTHTIGGKVNP